MPKITDPSYLLNDQYKDASNLDARVLLHRRFSTNPYGWYRWYFDQLELPAAARVLELGCGPGYLWRDNLDRIPAGWHITLSDFSPGMVAQARRNLQASLPIFRFQQIDAQLIPFEASTFDAVVANYMLHHVPDRLQALAEIWRVLQLNGRVFLGTNGQRHLGELHALLQRFDSASTLGWGGQTHELFSLDSGHTELELYFQNIQVRRYEDALVVTEVKPLVDYILSMSSAEQAQARRHELQDFIVQELATTGTIYIAKDSGLFIGRKSSRPADTLPG
jgi:ubiquinone/menaquinone biosynthesis C-methylase UbiE